MTLKEQVSQQCCEQVEIKMNVLEKTLHDLRESAANETKSTAGDKHETALAMLQIEQENTSRQLQEVLNQKLVLERINLHVQPIQVVQGSLVKTNKGYFFLSIALGKVKAGDNMVIALSPQSPLGAKLLGKKVNDMVEMNGVKYLIEEIA
ncbi:hypothetical protein [Aridibaculum aurantiacum]|uniref:hypothetical protein n=1 Tax=Aridibaculum aurantiacum TaxID=2810307 RepID=UPI001A96C6F8|nr:hypothetical protein [Aridibaculum aurantiacum]